MPLSQQDAEGIGLNISRALFPGYHERRADRAAAADLKRKQALEEMVATIAQRNAMEQLREREAGDTARADRANAAAMEREKLRLDRQGAWQMQDAGVASDNARMMAEQRAADEEADRLWRSKAAADELARRRVDDAMGWWGREQQLQLDKQKASFEQADKTARRPFEMLKDQAAAINAINIAREAGLGIEDAVMQKAGFKLGQPTANGKSGRPSFKSVTVQPAARVDYGAQAVTNSATNTPMPPDMNGQRRPSEAYSDVMGGSSFRELINVLTNKSFKP